MWKQFTKWICNARKYKDENSSIEEENSSNEDGNSSREDDNSSNEDGNSSIEDNSIIKRKDNVRLYCAHTCIRCHQSLFFVSELLILQ